MDTEPLSLSDQIKEFILNKKQDKLKELKKKQTTLGEDKYHEALHEIEQKYEFRNWFSSAASRAKQVKLVTHAPKFTHSDSKASGYLFQSGTNSNKYISSASFEKLEVDVVGNAASQDVANLLKLKDADGSLMYEQVQANNCPALELFAESPEEYQQWLDGLKAAFAATDIVSGGLTKQLYFPIDQGYHLINPQFASSLMHELFNRVRYSKFSEEQKEARQARRKNEFTECVTIQIPKLAAQSFGGSNAQNVSQLNSKRNGEGYLISCQPPVWNTSIEIKLITEKSFWRYLSRQTYKTFNALNKYLKAKKDHPSYIEIRNTRAEMVDSIIDRFFTLSQTIQKQKSGWSHESKIPLCEQLWLDPQRIFQDKDFQKEYDKGDWKVQLASAFALWFNRELAFETTTHEYDEWRRLLKRKLQLVSDVIEVQE